MARPSKYDTQIKDKLNLVVGWARDGLTNEQIAHNLGINTSTLYEYQKKHKEFSNALKNGKEVSDYEVESSLFKRANGYEYTEVTEENKWNTETMEWEFIITKKITKMVAPDPTSMIFWLKNRKPNDWRDRKETVVDTDSSTNLMDILKVALERNNV